MVKIGSGNDLSPARHQVITRTNVNWALGKREKIREILIQMQ